jgi:AraC-like DNA-binding protein
MALSALRPLIDWMIISVMRTSPFNSVRTVLQDFRYFESNDLDDTCERITTILQPHRLVPGKRGGPIHSHMDFLQLSGFGFCTLKYGSEMDVEVTGLADYHVLIFCLSGGGAIKTHDSEITINQRHGFVGNAGRSFRANFSTDCEQFIVRIDRKALQAHTGALELCSRPEIDLKRPEIAPWAHMLRALLAERKTLDLARKNARVAADYEQLLLDLLLESQPDEWGAKDRRHSVAPTTVRKAERFIHENLTKPVTLQDIARAAGVPPRTLHENFRRFRDSSPIRFLREARLDRANALLLAEGAERRICEIAVDCGFGHLGRFAQEYCERFGESPSRSVERAKRKACRTGDV